MNTPQQSTGWITRIFVALITAALFVMGFFFLTVALIAGVIVAVVVGARLWWTVRKLKRRPADDNVVAGEYRVIEHESAVVRLPPEQQK